MLLSEVFDYLSYGELRQVFVGGDDGGVQPAKYPQLVTNINLGLIELYKRFPINTRELTLQLYSHITMYTLHTDFAQSDPNVSGETYKYILDDDAPENNFTDDILLITHVYNEIGEEFPLNDLDIETSVFTPTPTTLQMQYPDSENTLSVIYRAYPEKIAYVGLTDPTTVTLALPAQFLEALTAFVAYRHFAPLNVGQENGDANFYYAKFEAACNLINHLGTLNQDTNMNMKFQERGWI
jgi:hypothetical protein